MHRAETSAADATAAEALVAGAPKRSCNKRVKAKRRFLLIGYGNPGRLDDGLGPALAAQVEKLGIPGLTVDSDYQLTVEHAADVAPCDAVVFADAAVSGPEPFGFREIRPTQGTTGFSSHALEPEDVLALAHTMFKARTRGFALGIRGYRFNEFGETLSAAARGNLAAAVTFVEKTIRNGLSEWMQAGKIQAGSSYEAEEQEARDPVRGRRQGFSRFAEADHRRRRLQGGDRLQR
jgi:hydrogenase maturation protease